MDWLGVAFLRMDRLLGSHAVLVEFFDTARINSHRTLPYVAGWHARYADHGLRVIGVHSPGYSFGRDPEVVERAVARLGVEHPVVLDPQLEIWHSYGNRGWPGRYLFDRRGYLRYIHYGEGDYLDAERAIGERAGRARRRLRAAAAPGADPARGRRGRAAGAPDGRRGATGRRRRLELVRDWTDGEDWIEAADAGAAASVTFDAGGEAWAVLSGTRRAGPATKPTEPSWRKTRASGSTGSSSRPGRP